MDNRSPYKFINFLSATDEVLGGSIRRFASLTRYCASILDQESRKSSRATRWITVASDENQNVEVMVELAHDTRLREMQCCTYHQSLG